MQNIVYGNRYNTGVSYWLGGSCGNNCAAKSNGGGIWVWESGEPWSYTNWYSGEPSYSYNYEGCLEVYSSYYSFTWNDLPCSEGHAYVCETSSIIT